jgi:hypothetical protein
MVVRSADLETLLYFQHDVLSRRQARRYFSAEAIRHRLRSGRWLAVHRGIYLTVPRQMTWEQSRWVALLVAAPDPSTGTAFVAGEAALHLWGLATLRCDVVDLLLPATRTVARLPRGAVAHRTTQLPAADRDDRARMPCTTPARSLVDAAQWARTDRRARMLVAMAFQHRLVDLDGVQDVLGRLRKVHRGSLIARTAADAAGGAHSLAELDFLGLSRAAGLPEPTLQKRRRDASGRIRYLDVLYEQYGVHVEIDGAHHLDVQQAWADMRRHNDLWIKGTRVLRFPAWLVREHPDQVIAQVRAALVAAGWRPGS